MRSICESSPPPARSDSTRLGGDLNALRRDAFSFWTTTARQAPVMRIRFGPVQRLVISDAALAQHVLVTRRDNYIKDQRLKRILEDGAGPVLATSDGADWAWRRQLMQPLFGHRRIQRVTEIIHAQTDRMLDDWSTSDTVDVLAAMKTLTLRIIVRAMFSARSHHEEDALHRAYATLGRALVRRATSLVPAPRWVPTPDNRRLHAALDTIHGSLRSIVEERRRGAPPRHDLLEALLAARTEAPDRGLDAEAIVHEMSAIVFAGHDTTAAALSWTLALIAHHPEVAARVRAELDATPAPRDPAADGRGRLPYLRRVIDESMRCFPPLYVNSRQAVGPDQLLDHSIAPGTRLLINILGIHRDPRRWREPDRFCPDRFDPDRAPDRHRFAFLPFLGGPRRCLGASLAMAELQVILSSILRRFTPVLATGRLPVPELAAVLEPRGTLPMVLEARRA